MKGEHSLTNKIVPVKALIQNSKISSRKQELQLGTKEPWHISQGVIHTPKIIKQECPLASQFEHQDSSRKLNNRATSFNKDYLSLNDIPNDEEREEKTPRKGRPQPEKYSSAKIDRPEKVETKNVSQTCFGLYENYKRQQIKNHAKDIEQVSNKMKGKLHESTQFLKSVSLNKDSSQLYKQSSIMFDNSSAKLDDETWHVSKFSRIMNTSREVQPFFMNDLTKIKTQLFQKQAQLIESNKMLQQKQAIILELTSRLQAQGVPRKADSQRDELGRELKRLQILLYSQSKKTERKGEELEQVNTDRKMLLLKIRQYELDQKQKSQFILDLKEKEKRLVESTDRMVNGQRQLLRQKEGQLIIISQTAQKYKNQLQRQLKDQQMVGNNGEREQFSKEVVIHELSCQLSDLKAHLHQVENRMRQMIESEQELRRELELQKEQAKDTEKSTEKRQREMKSIRSSLLQNETKMKEMDSQCSGKDFQLSLMSKVCDEYIKKIAEYQQYYEQARYQTSNDHRSASKSGRMSLTPPKSVSPLREAKTDNKELLKVKGMNSKLSRDNQRLSSAVKDLGKTVYRLYQVNKGLNQSRVESQLMLLNGRFKEKEEYDY